MPYAVKFGYIGWKFHGYQVQPGVRTVEGDIKSVLREHRAGEWTGGSRTDAGVSARGNVARLDTDDPMRALRILNAHVEDAFFWAYAEVGADFNPRHAVMRWYRYFLPFSGHDMDAMRSAAAHFVGRHDFRGFCRPDGRDTIREIQSVELQRRGAFIVLDIRGRSFLWQMVRRIVAFLNEVGLGRRDCEEAISLLQGEGEYTAAAPPERLILVDVDTGFGFTPVHMSHLRDHLVKTALEGHILSEVACVPAGNLKSA
jgi:tRNA pseudouridine38-40 synthase